MHFKLNYCSGDGDDHGQEYDEDPTVFLYPRGIVKEAADAEGGEPRAKYGKTNKLGILSKQEEHEKHDGGDDSNRNMPF